jgi:hypothetical protein
VEGNGQNQACDMAQNNKAYFLVAEIRSYRFCDFSSLDQIHGPTTFNVAHVLE